MTAALVAIALASSKQSLFIENDPRLTLPCTVIEDRTTLKSVIQRLSKSSGVKLVDDYDCPDPVLKVFIRNRHSGRVLQMLAKALDLDWQRVGNDWRLFRPDYVKRAEQSYDREARAASIQEYRTVLTEWRERRSAQSGDAAMNYAVPELVASLCLDAGRDVLKRIENGETVVGCTAPVPGTTKIVSSPPGGQPRFAAVRLDTTSARLAFSTWDEDPRSGFSRYAWSMNGTTEYSSLIPSTSLAERNAGWAAFPYLIVSALMKPLEQTGAEHGRIKVTSPGMDLSDALVDRLGFSMILVGPQRKPIAATMRGEVPIDEACSMVVEALNPGYCRLDGDFLLWRPVHYRYRADLARPLPLYSAPASREATAMGALLETVEQSQAYLRAYRDNEMMQAACLDLACPDSSLVRLMKALPKAQLKKAFYGHPTVGTDGRFTDAAVGIALADLAPSLRKLALDTMRSQLLLSRASFKSPKLADWASILNPAGTSPVRFVIVAQRRDSVWVRGAGGREGYSELPTAEQWQEFVNRDGWQECTVERFWIMEFGFGIPGGPSIRSVINQRSIVLSMPAADVKRLPEQARDRARRIMEASTGISTRRVAGQTQ